LPGDLHKLWRVRDPLGYHVEYAYSTMGYEIAGSLGVRRGAPDRDVIALVGDGSYLMLHTELVTAVAEGIKVIVVIVQNQGFASIGHLSESVGNDRFGTKYRYLDPKARNFDGDRLLPVDLAANARSYGVDVIGIAPGPDATAELGRAIRTAKAKETATVIHINSDPLVYAPDGEGWWDVPVAEVSTLDSTKRARKDYVKQRDRQKPLLG
jgi:3D-(3,5/4)-trihydroxycyclohexane-1,2-dione acylhydrolase (decyclizing)